jgi:ribosomal protein L34E
MEKKMSGSAKCPSCEKPIGGRTGSQQVYVEGMPSRKTMLLLFCQHCGFPLGPIVAQLAIVAAMAQLSGNRLQPRLGGEYAAFVAMKRIFNA